uniref:AMP-dependent synthetase/ligase domain-containing protein n=1 Tax=Timema douglasi TaxID=61478 RepID=A0A7R8VN79_TIMDO|nr:unnamed protein product [Timema douglasi]
MEWASFVCENGPFHSSLAGFEKFANDLLPPHLSPPARRCQSNTSGHSYLCLVLNDHLYRNKTNTSLLHLSKCSFPPNHGALCDNTVCTLLIRAWGLQNLLCLTYPSAASDVRRAYGWPYVRARTGKAPEAMPDSDYILRGPPEILLTETSLGEHFRDKLQEHSDSTVLIHADTGQKMTQADLLVSSERLAVALQAQGVGPGDVIGVCSENSLEYCIPVLAALYVGATCAPLSAGYTPRELMHAMSLSRPRLIFCSEGAEPLVREAADRVAGLAEEVVVMGRERQFLRHLTLDMFVSDYVSEQGRPQHFHLHRVEHPKEHVAFIFCSSGTTGLPKGVMITHHNVLSLMASQRYAVESDNLPLIEGYALGFLPMYHAYGLMTLLYMLEFESTMVVMPHFNPETFLRTIQEYKVILLAEVIASSGRVEPKSFPAGRGSSPEQTVGLTAPLSHLCQ